MLEWFDVKEKLPEKNGEDCLLYSEESDRTVGPICWSESGQGWLDIFWSYEAGALFTPGKAVSHWAKFNYPPEIEKDLEEHRISTQQYHWNKSLQKLFWDAYGW